MRECQSHWRKNFLPYTRYVATIPCESLKHKSNTFHTNISTSHMFISITFTETSIDETNKNQQKVWGSKFMLKMSTIHGNTCIQTTTPLHNRCRYDGVVQQPPLPQQTFFQLLHIMDPRVVDPLLKHTTYAVVHQIQIWRIRWPYLSRDKLWRLSLSAAWWQCHVHDVLVPHLAEKVVIPENRADIRQKHIQQNCIPVIITADTPGFKKCSCVAPRLDTATETISDCAVA